MTLIAIATHGDSAQFITDTGTYNGYGNRFGRATKSIVLSHLGGALICQGDGPFGHQALTRLLATSGDAHEDLDGLLSRTPGVCRSVWADEVEFRRQEGWQNLHDSTIFVVGYSARRGEYVACYFASEDDFTETPLTDVFIHPSPMNCRPSVLELARLRASGQCGGSRAGKLDDWERLHPYPARPTTADEWRRIALTARQDRSLSREYGHLKTYVLGDVFLTTLTANGTLTERIHTFDDTGDELAQLVWGTAHPLGQLADCPCGSGRILVECCMVPYLDQPCSCGQRAGKTMRECCMVKPSP